MFHNSFTKKDFISRTKKVNCFYLAFRLMFCLPVMWKEDRVMKQSAMCKTVDLSSIDPILYLWTVHKYVFSYNYVDCLRFTMLHDVVNSLKNQVSLSIICLSCLQDVFSFI